MYPHQGPPQAGVNHYTQPANPYQQQQFVVYQHPYPVAGVAVSPQPYYEQQHQQPPPLNHSISNDSSANTSVTMSTIGSHAPQHFIQQSPPQHPQMVPAYPANPYRNPSAFQQPATLVPYVAAVKIL